MKKIKSSGSTIKKVEPKNAIVLGVDPSLNGSGFVLKKNGLILDYWFFTPVIKNSKDQHAILNREADTKRLNNIFNFFENLTKEHKIDYMGIENYAFGAKGNSTFQIGGIGELLRLMSYRSGIPFVELEPPRVKKFATGAGNAEKSSMVLAAYKDGFDVGLYGKSGEDLADAYWIATMVENLVFIHNDKSYVGNLNKHQLETFTEITKSYPIPLRDRQFYK